MNSLLFVNNAPEPGKPETPGGGDVSALLLLEGLRERGWRIRVAMPSEGRYGRKVRELGLETFVFPPGSLSRTRPFHNLRVTAFWLHRLRIGGKPDLVALNHPGLVSSLGPAARMIGVPLVAHVRIPFTQEEAAWWRRFHPRLPALIFNSHYLEKEMTTILHRLGVSVPTFTVHNAVDTHSFPPSPYPGDAEKKIIGMFANLTPAKNHEELLRAAQRIQSRRTDTEFWFVGEDPTGGTRTATLGGLARELGLAECARFLGPREDVPELMRRCHLVVLASRMETFGRVLIEAMSCGRPVVATAVGGIPEVVEDGRTGLLYPAGDHEALAERILHLLDHPGEAARMGEAGAESVRRRFGRTAHATRIDTIYRRVAGLPCPDDAERQADA